MTAKNYYGDMCLHHVVSNASNWPSHPAITAAVKNSLVLLIQAGADVYAKNDKGCSVSARAYSLHSPCAIRHVWEEALSDCGYDATWFREDFCKRKHAVSRDLCPCRGSGGTYNFEETNSLDITHDNFSVNSQYFKHNESDIEKFQDDKQSSESNEQTFQETGPDDQSFQDIERPFDAITQDSHHVSLPYDPISLNSTWSSFTSHPHGLEQTMDDINIWNQPDSESGEQDIERLANFTLPPEGLSWVEDVPDAGFTWAWESKAMSQITSSISPWNPISLPPPTFEVEDHAAENWNTM